MNKEKVFTFLTVSLLWAGSLFSGAFATNGTDLSALVGTSCPDTINLSADATVKVGKGVALNLNKRVVINAVGHKVSITGESGAKITGRLFIFADDVTLSGINLVCPANEKGVWALLNISAKTAKIENNVIDCGYSKVTNSSIVNGLQIYPLQDTPKGGIVLSNNTVKNALGAQEVGDEKSKEASVGIMVFVGAAFKGNVAAGQTVAPEWNGQVTGLESTTFENCLTDYEVASNPEPDSQATPDQNVIEAQMTPVPEDLYSGLSEEERAKVDSATVKTLVDADRYSDANPGNKPSVKYNGTPEQFDKLLESVPDDVVIEVELADGSTTTTINPNNAAAPKFAMMQDTFFYKVELPGVSTIAAAGNGDITIPYRDSTLVLVTEPDTSHYYVVAFDTIGIVSPQAYVGKLKTDSLKNLFGVVDDDELLTDASVADTAMWKYTDSGSMADGNRIFRFKDKNEDELEFADSLKFLYTVNGTPYGDKGVQVNLDTIKHTGRASAKSDSVVTLGFYKLPAQLLWNKQVDLLSGGIGDGFTVNVKKEEGGTLGEGDVFSGNTLVAIPVEADKDTTAFYLAYLDADGDTTNYIVATPVEEGSKNPTAMDKYTFTTETKDKFEKTPAKYNGVFRAYYDPKGAHPMYLTNPKFYELDSLEVQIGNTGWAKVGWTRFDGTRDVLTATAEDSQNEVTFTKSSPAPTVSDRISASTLLTGQYYNVEFVNKTDKTMKDASGKVVVDPDQTYKKDGLLTVIYSDRYGYGFSQPDYYKVHADSVNLRKAYLSSPDAQWVVKRVELAGDTEKDENGVVRAAGSKDTIMKGLVTLVNREHPGKTVDSLYLYKTDEKDVYLVHSFRNFGIEVKDSTSNAMDDYGVNVIAGDLLKFTPVENITEFDGFKHVEDPNALIDTVYTIAVLNNPVNEIANAYWVEKHPSETHQIGLDGNVKEATHWNLHVLTKDVNGEDVSDFALVKDTVWTVVEDTIQSRVDTLNIQQYAIQNDDNNEFVAYNYNNGFEYYICDPSDKIYNGNEDVFALKQRPNGAYHIVSLAYRYVAWADQTNHMVMGDKLFGLRDQNQGSVKKMDNYKDDGNSLMLIEPVGMPEYRRFSIVEDSTELGLDTIKIFTDYESANVLYEKKDSLNKLSTIPGSGTDKTNPKDWYSFLNSGNEVQLNAQLTAQHKDFNPALFVDTAYVNRPGNNRWQYLLAVNVRDVEGGEWVCPYNEEHNKPEWREEHGGPCADAVQVGGAYKEGRYLVNLIDTANAYGAQAQVHGNPFINAKEAGNEKAKLAFVWARHFTNDSLVFYKGPKDWMWKAIPEDAEVWKTLDLNTSDLKIATFAFRYEDVDAQSFKIQTLWKQYGNPATARTSQDGYLRLENGTVVVANGLEQGEVFNLEPLEGVTPTENESIATGNVTADGADGAVIVKGAEGKTVIVTTILGKVVANEVLTSDNAAVAAPAGIVVVSVDGESYKVVVR